VLDITASPAEADRVQEVAEEVAATCVVEPVVAAAFADEGAHIQAELAQGSNHLFAMAASTAGHENHGVSGIAAVWGEWVPSNAPDLVVGR